MVRKLGISLFLGIAFFSTHLLSATVQEPRLALRGRVVTDSGQPQAGAEVLLFAAIDAYERGRQELAGRLLPKAVDQTLTDRDGRFFLVLPAAGAWQVQIQKAGWVPVASLWRVYVEEEWLPTVRLRKDVGKAVTPPGAKDPGFRLFAATPPLRSKTWRGSFWAPRFRYAFLDEKGRVRFPRAEGEELFVSPVGPGSNFAHPRQIRLVDPSGEPASGSLVLVDGRATALTNDLGQAALTFAAGQEIVVLGPGGWRWQLSAQDPLSSERKDPITLKLPPIQALGCRITDPKDHPLAGVLVWARHNRDSLTRTDAKGQATLPWPSQDEVLRAAAVGYESKAESLPRNAAQWTLKLTPVLSVRGWVVDEKDHPVAGVQVGTTAATETTLKLRKAVETMTDGSFRLPSVDATQLFRLVAQKEGFAPVEQILHPTKDDLSTLRVVLRQGMTLTGRLVDSQGQPIEGAAASASAPSIKEWSCPEARQEALSDEEGFWTLPHLSLPTVQLFLSAHGFAPRWISEIRLPEKEGTEDLGEIQLEPALKVSGTVRDEEGRSVEGAKVLLRGKFVRGTKNAQLMQCQPAESRMTSSDSSGHFQFVDLPRLPALSLNAHKRGYGSITQEIHRDAEEDPPEEVLLVLKKSRAVAGKVVNENDEPVASAIVVLRLEENPPRGQSPTISQETDQSGRFQIDFGSGHSLSAIAMKGPRTSDLHKNLKVEPDHPLELTLKLRHRAVVRGIVVDAKGSPVARARIRVEQADSLLSSETGTTSDAQGHFELAGLPGPAIVSAHLEEQQASAETSLSEGGDAFVRLVLGQSGVLISGRVVDTQDIPVGFARVHWESSQGSTTMSHSSSTDQEGRFSNRVEPGHRVLLRIQAPGYRLVELPFETQDLPRDDLLIRLEPGPRIRGVVTGLSKEGLAEAVAGARTEGKRPFFSDSRTPVAQDGTFLLDSLTEGTWQVFVELPRVGRSSEETVTLAAGLEEQEVQIRFEDGLSLRGTLFANGVVQPYQSLVLRSSAGEMQVATDSAGRFFFEGVGAGGVQVLALFGSRKLELVGDLEVDLDFRSYSLTGILVDNRDGFPLQGVRVMLNPFGSHPSIAAFSGSDGRFHFELVPEGSALLMLTKEGFAQHSVSVIPEELAGQEIEIRLDKGQPLMVQPQPPVGSPLPAEAALFAISSTGALEGVFQATLSPEGFLVSSSFPRGSRQLFLLSEQYATVVLTVMVPGEPYPVVLEPATSLLVRIPPIGGAPALGALRLFRNGEALLHPTFLREVPSYASAEKPVEFPVRGLPSGSWTLELTMDNGRTLRGQAATSAGQPTVVELR